MKIERKIGFVLILIAVVCILEANRLRVYPSSFGIGAPTFPFVVGIFIALSGLYFSFAAGGADKKHIKLPRGDVAKKMLATMAVMIAYSVILPFLGYATSTLISSVLLLKIIAKYNWILSIFVGLFITLILYFTFNRLVYIPFPTGIIWNI